MVEQIKMVEIKCRTPNFLTIFWGDSHFNA